MRIALSFDGQVAKLVNHYSLHLSQDTFDRYMYVCVCVCVCEKYLTHIGPTGWGEGIH